MITLYGQTLIIDAAGLVLEGLGSNRNNNQPLLVVDNQGKLELRNGTIRGNTLQGGNLGNGGGVWIGNQSSFTMSGGAITGNTAARSGNSGGSGGGVFISKGNFTMTGGTINGNTANQGGGVYKENNSTLSRTGGTITGNKPDDVYEQ